MKAELLLPSIFARQMPDGSAINMQGLSEFPPAENDQTAALSCYQQSLLQNLGQSARAASNLPIADCLYLDANAQSNVCMQAVHLDASHDNARMLPAQCLQITLAESQKLAASLNALWNPDGIDVVVHSPTEWQLSGLDATALDCLPASMLAYRSVADAMPRSGDAAQWRQLLTEAQMLLHDHPVNQHRQSQGLRSINAVWCFGGASLDAEAISLSTLIFSNDAFASGLAQKLKLACNPFTPAGFLGALTGNEEYEQVVVVDAALEQAWLANDLENFVGLRKQLIDDLLLPLKGAAAGSALMGYSIDDGNGSRYTWQRNTGLLAKLKGLFKA